MTREEEARYATRVLLIALLLSVIAHVFTKATS